MTFHSENINCITQSPDGSLFATSDKTGKILVWNPKIGISIYSLDIGREIEWLEFDSDRYWLYAGTSLGVTICDLETRKLTEKDFAGCQV